MPSNDNDDDDDNVDDNGNILEDRPGHINRDLAERIWAWEQESRKIEKLGKVEYSVRSGLRLVDALVDEILLKYGRGKRNQSLRSDLIQEGLSSLLDAMRQYRHQADEESSTRSSTYSTTSNGFEVYARQRILKQLIQSVRKETNAERPPRLPQAVESVVLKARRVMMQRKQTDSENATWEAVAEEMQIPFPRLQTYLRLANRRSPFLSMESTVEIMHPSTLEGPAYRDQDEFELREGLLLDDGHKVQKDQVISEYLDETLENEGDDQAWVHEERIAGPLTDLIPDTSEPSPDDLILQELIQNDLSSFLTSSLEEQEVEVVQLIFGLQDKSSSSKGAQTMKQTAKALNIEAEEVSKILARALQKLRVSYWSRFLDKNDGESVEAEKKDDYDDEDYTVDSV